MIYHYLPIWWTLWGTAGGALALALIGTNLWRRRKLARTGNPSGITLPTTREDLLWAALVLAGGAVGLGVILLLVSGYHTARALFVAAFIALVMLLGLVMLLKNGLAPTDAIQLDAPETEEGQAAEPALNEEIDLIEITQKHPRLRPWSGDLG